MAPAADADTVPAVAVPVAGERDVGGRAEAEPAPGRPGRGEAAQQPDVAADDADVGATVAVEVAHDGLVAGHAVVELA